MDRASLTNLDREELIERAHAAGVPNARILTRPELVDEIVLRTSEGPVGRGFFGRARDLLSRVIERGLHLPEAADLFRAAPADTPRGSYRQASVPTFTLAEIYARQGHVHRAIEILERVLHEEPTHEAAATRLSELRPLAASEADAPSADSPDDELPIGAAGASEGIPTTPASTAEHDPGVPPPAPVTTALSVTSADAGAVVFSFAVDPTTHAWLRSRDTFATIVLVANRVNVSGTEVEMIQEETVPESLVGHYELSRRPDEALAVALGYRGRDDFRALAHVVVAPAVAP